jgi:4-amino-4-deoxy-L-arabinose transferase-like glycosyltransferase
MLLRAPTRVWCLAIALFASYAWFYPAGGWNQNSRFDLTRALIDHQTIAIDAYAKNTGDLARGVGGHLFTDKAPGQPVLAVPFVAAARVTGASLDGQAWFGTLFTAAIPTVVTALLVLWLAGRLGASPAAGTAAAIAFGLGTPAWAYATLYWAHALATACVVGALALAIILPERATSRGRLLVAALIGAVGALAVATEYPSAPPVVLVGLYALYQTWRTQRTPAAVARVAAAMVVGAIPVTALLLAYHQAAFGTPFTTPLAHLVGFANVRQRPFHAPSGDALFQILLGAKRGLFPLAPALAAGLVGLGVGIALRGDRARRVLVGVAAALVLYYFLFNASFATPLAGWSFGPRYLAPAFPFMALGIAALWDRTEAWGRYLRWALAGLVAWGVAVSLVAVSTTPQAPEQYKNPMVQLMGPAFLDGDLSINPQSIDERGADPYKLRRQPRATHAAWNLGERMGLPGTASLVPLFALWVGAVVIAVRASRARRSRARHEAVSGVNHE